MLYEQDTIAALATHPGPAGVAIIRVSGPDTRRISTECVDSAWSPIENARRLVFGRIVNPNTGTVIDHGLAVFMPAPHSFTGEDSLEFQIHGSPLLVQMLLRALYENGIRPAEPGEFSKRAFLNGKMDLTQAEGLADLISAGSMQALKIAEEQFHGKLGSHIHNLGETLRDSLAEIEASIDFPEEDIEPATINKIKTAIDQTTNSISLLIKSYEQGHVIRDGFRVLLCGRPNAGKSSLLNALLKKPRAIVSEISGTTRDLIEESIDLDGYRFVFCDSAGITQSEDPIEKIGVELAIERVSWANLVLLVTDINESQSNLDQIVKILSTKAKKIWLVVNKIDQARDKIGSLECYANTCQQVVYLSALQGEGLEQLSSALIQEINGQLSSTVESTQVITNERQRACLVLAERALVTSISAIEQSMPLEIIASDLRTALGALDELIGKTSPEDILGRIFSKFCIGK
mgnify:CR=1 FL=1